MLLSALILLLFQLIFNYSLEGHLESYSREREETINRQIAGLLVDYYRETGNWLGVQMPLFHAALSTNTRLLLYSAQGQLIGDTGQGRHQMMMMRDQQPELRDLQVYQYDLELDSEVVGTLVIAHPLTVETSAMLQQDLAFRRAISGSLIWTGLIAIGAALILGVLFSRRLSAPLEEISRAAVNITKGDYSQQLPAYRNRELDELAMCFNQLASHLQELEQLRKRSVADISHELRTPLATLRSYVEAVKDGVLPADTKTMGVLLEEIMHMNRVATDLDELARFESMKEEQIKRENVNMNQFMLDKVATFQPMYQAKNVELNLSLPEQKLMSNQDPYALGKIIGNLLDNAYRYTSPGGVVEVTLSEKPIIEPGAISPVGYVMGDETVSDKSIKDMFMIRVSDNGIGIGKQQLPYVFERFFRVDPSREREQSRAGSGIGLSLVKELVRASGGFIMVSSIPGEGTTFYIYLKR
ncbi:MAG: HAMP domain-containing sensor histidine kinase [Bacillota bacterium]|nr:HAMP domain-containing sensor histidine kinase [Bacillota bacterium]